MGPRHGSSGTVLRHPDDAGRRRDDKAIRGRVLRAGARMGPDHVSCNARRVRHRRVHRRGDCPAFRRGPRPLQRGASPGVRRGSAPPQALTA